MIGKELVERIEKTIYEDLLPKMDVGRIVEAVNKLGEIKITRAYDTAEDVARFRAKIPSLWVFVREGAWQSVKAVIRLRMIAALRRAVVWLDAPSALNILNLK